MHFIEPAIDDDPSFVELVDRLARESIKRSGLTSLVLCHLDHWFGPRWLGFCGKMLGAAGVRDFPSRRGQTPPPFHPHRLQSAVNYSIDSDGLLQRGGDVGWLHLPIKSENNLYRSLLTGKQYLWYSGDTQRMDQGSIMVYQVHRRWRAAWYVGFLKKPNWRVHQTIAISRERVGELLEGGS